ncbi:MAG: N-6 DNA methylase [candidate division WOR-3 bacterium]|nr:N-6 DNA methylase [candidate division WOR-3 bacterium]
MSSRTSSSAIDSPAYLGFEQKLWQAADTLRANSGVPSNEYFLPVMGLLFLRYAYSRYLAVKDDVEASLPVRGGKRRPATKEDYSKRGAILLRPEAQYDYLVSLPEGADLAKAVAGAMESIEADYTSLKGQLPKAEYQELGKDVLGQLLRKLNPEELKTAPLDVFGRIYEYFLTQFADQKAHDGGEFFTPSSLVTLIANVLEPERGTVLDIANGSAGMFVQSARFVRLRHENPNQLTFRGVEKIVTTIRLAKMNLAVHGLEGDIKEGNTYYEDPHELFGKADYVMSNPPFNVDEVDADKVKRDPRLPFGLPGVNKEGKVSNGNYLWISYFWSYLNPKGRAGFVMSSQASSAGHKEAEVRRKIVETGDVDVMVSIRSNFFYTRTVPCELWFFDKGKPKDRRDSVLMLDCRNIYRKVTRRVFDFSPEQQQNIAAIVWLYRGQRDRFIALVQEYLDKTILEASHIAAVVEPFKKGCAAITIAVESLLGAKPKQANVQQVMKERCEAATACFDSLANLTARIAKDWPKPCKPELVAQSKRLAELAELATACRDLVKDVDLVYKLTGRVADALEQSSPSPLRGEGRGEESGASVRVLKRLLKELDEPRRALVEQLKQTAYFERQAHWLLSRFPKAEFCAVPGLCRVVSRADIEKADWSLTPGRYVGVAPQEVDEDFDFEQTIHDIHTELADLNKEAAALAGRIQQNLEELGA